MRRRCAVAADSTLTRRDQLCRSWSRRPSRHAVLYVTLKRNCARRSDGDMLDARSTFVTLPTPDPIIQRYARERRNSPAFIILRPRRDMFYRYPDEFGASSATSLTAAIRGVRTRPQRVMRRQTGGADVEPQRYHRTTVSYPKNDHESYHARRGRAQQRPDAEGRERSGTESRYARPWQTFFLHQLTMRWRRMQMANRHCSRICAR